MNTGHFYFGKNRTFLLWLDKTVSPVDFPVSWSRLRIKEDIQ